MTKTDEIIVYSETNNSRKMVGKLSRTKSDFIFQYDEKWLVAKRTIPIGPDLPLTIRPIKSNQLFPSFKDRIPDRNSANYENYCLARGISPKETDTMILLGSLGHKGPSTFVFELSNKSIRHTRVNSILKHLLGFFSFRELGKILNVQHSVLQNFDSKYVPDTLTFNYLEATFQNADTFIFRTELNQFLTDELRVEAIRWVSRNRKMFEEMQQRPARRTPA